ncbi:MAG: hypothetical protein AAFR67_01065, partial [Chloroflexota bacterium]
MKQPIEKNLLQTFRFFLLMRLMLTLFSLAFQLQPLEYLRDTLANTTITVIVLVYLYLRPLQTWLGRLYLPIAVSIVSMHLLIKQRLIQFRTTQLDLSLERDLLRILEAFTSSSVENTAIPLLFTLATTTFLFVPLVLIS